MARLHCLEMLNEGESMNAKGKPKKLCLVTTPDLSILLQEAMGKTVLSEGWVVSNSSPSDVEGKTVLSKIWRYIKMMVAISKCNVVCFVFVDERAVRLMKFAKMLGKKVVFFWIGSDVFRLMEGSLKPTSEPDIHVADGDGLVGELRDCGIISQSVPIVPNISSSIAKMPQHHSVMLNIPDDRLDFYNYDAAVSLIRMFPDTKFVVVRSNSPELYDYPNVDFRGVVDPENMNDVYDDVSIIWRFPEHDGLSLASMEALTKGKYIISRFPFPNAMQAETFEEGVEQLRKLLEGTPYVNEEGRQYALQNFTQESSGRTFCGCLNKLMGVSDNQAAS